MIVSRVRDFILSFFLFGAFEVLVRSLCVLVFLELRLLCVCCFVCVFA